MEYDVVIVGARVAGASLALLLGRQSRRVLLVDRDAFPSNTLSTHFLSGFVVAQLAELGVLPDVEALGLRRITRMRSYVADCFLDGPQVGPGPFNYALAPPRDGLDSILIQHAQRHPSVTFRERTSAEGLLWEDGRVVGALLRSGASREEVRAAVIVGADGRHSRVAQWVEAAAYEERAAARPGYYGYYRGVTPLAEPAAELFSQGGEFGFLFPMQPGIDCLALEIRPDDFERFRQDPEGAFEARYRQLHGMAARMAGARREGPIYGTRGIPNFLRQSYGPGWALAGDAACCKDPLTGTGIGDAFTHAVLLAGALGQALDGANWESTLGGYQHRRDALLLPTFRATIGFVEQPETSPEALAWLRATLANPFWSRTLADHIQSAVAAPGVFAPPTLTRIAEIARLHPVPVTTTGPQTEEGVG